MQLMVLKYPDNSSVISDFLETSRNPSIKVFDKVLFRVKASKSKSWSLKRLVLGMFSYPQVVDNF